MLFLEKAQFFLICNEKVRFLLDASLLLTVAVRTHDNYIQLWLLWFENIIIIIIGWGDLSVRAHNVFFQSPVSSLLFKMYKCQLPQNKTVLYFICNLICKFDLVLMLLLRSVIFVLHSNSLDKMFYHVFRCALAAFLTLNRR